MPCPPPILVYAKYFFGESRNDKTTDNNGKRNDNVQTLYLFEVFLIFLRNYWRLTTVHKCDAISVLLTRLFSPVKKRVFRPRKDLFFSYILVLNIA